MSEESGRRWDEGIRLAIERDYDEVKKLYPYFVKRISTSTNGLELDVGDWLMSVGDNHLVLEKRIFIDTTRPVVVTHAFRYEADALAFKLRFPCE